MKLKGVLDFSLGNFLCVRGFAPLGELSDHSRADESYQRKTSPQQAKKIKQFLAEGRYTFFPELILGVSLEACGVTDVQANELFEDLRAGRGFSRKVFGELGLSVYVSRTAGVDRRTPRLHMTATLDGLEESGEQAKITRIDGNHRLDAVAALGEKERSYKTPYCLVLFRNDRERDEFSRVFFHNINFKALHLTREQNLKLILEDESIFPDEMLKLPEPFGWPYYHARKLHGKLDLELLPNVGPFLKDESRTFLLEQFEFLIARDVLNDNDNAIKRFKEALRKVNGLFDELPALGECKNRGLLAALIYYELKKDAPVRSFVRWVLDNHLHLIEKSGAKDLIAIFDKVLTSRKRTIFVSMPFTKSAAANHYAIIERVAREISDNYGLKPPLKVQRVDWFHDGTSYVISDKIIQMMSDCGLLIGNLTYCNPNVYHEIGFVMGKAKAEGLGVANMLLFLDESVADGKDKFVGFNLDGIKQLRFNESEKFAADLKTNLERFFKLDV